MDLTADALETTQKVRRHPRIEDFEATLRVLLKNKLAMVGLTITLIYAAITILDYVYPQYLGINPGTGALSDALISFGRTAGVTWQGHAYFVGSTISIAAPYGADVPFTIVPPTLNGPTGTPGWWWWLGGTAYFLPILPVMLAGLKFDLTYTLLIVFFGALVGTVLGTISGYYGGILDEVLMRITDIFFSVPFLILAIAISYALGATVQWVIFAIIIIWWPTYARLTRGQALGIKSNKFVEAARASGSSNLRIVFSHILPNVLAPVFIQISLDVGVIVQVFATLDFLGFHFTSITLPEIGNMMNWGDQPNYLFAHPMNWWPVVIPGIFLVIFTIAVNLFGDGLRDVLDPKLRR